MGFLVRNIPLDFHDPRPQKARQKAHGFVQKGGSVPRHEKSPCAGQ